MKHIGRPVSAECDAAEKPCEFCGRIFRLREQRFQSLRRFSKRRFCSEQCAKNARSEAAGQVGDFWDRLTTTSAGCMEWTGRKYTNGYGMMMRRGKNVRTHRFAYEQAKGPIPEGMMILHSCDNPPCCNPNHLRAGTAAENAQDAISRGRRPGRKPKVHR